MPDDLDVGAAWPRAFKRRFVLTPSAYRSRGLLDGGDDRAAQIHTLAVAGASPV